MIPTRATSGTASIRTWLRGLKEQLLSQIRQPLRRRFCSHECEFLEIGVVMSANAIAGIVRMSEQTGTFHHVANTTPAPATSVVRTADPTATLNRVDHSS